DEVAVEEAGDAGVRERLARHDVAPVTGRVPDRQEDRLVLALRLAERLLPPGIPGDRILRVLEAVGARLPREVVRAGGGDPRRDPGAHGEGRETGEEPSTAGAAHGTGILS